MPALPQPCSRENTLSSNPGTIPSGTRFNNEPIYGLTPAKSCRPRYGYSQTPALVQRPATAQHVVTAR